MKIVNITALVLIIIGGINWGLVGFLDYNLVDTIFGVGSTMARSIYTLVGLAAIYVLIEKSYMMMKMPNKAKY